MSTLVTLTTDFGHREPSVAEIKGVIYSGCPDARVVDLSHGIGRGDVMEASLFLQRAVPRFPESTIHMVNVAPGPRPIVATVEGQHLLLPDNGLLTLLAHHHSVQALHAVDMPAGLGNGPGQVFFGRDIIAPAAARLASGAAPHDLGPPLDDFARLRVARPERSDRLLTGEIIHVDRFGNLVTNVHVSDLEGVTVQRIEAGGFPLGPLRRSYDEVPPNSPLALLGGSGYLEVAYNGDRADSRLDFGPGIRIRIELERAAG